MAYDNQAPGWYLINPEVDGTPPGGEAGGVTHVSSKEGYGLMNSIVSVIGDQIGSDNADMIRDVSESITGGKKSEVSSSPRPSSTTATEVDNPIPKAASSSSSPKQSSSSSVAGKSTTSVAPAPTSPPKTSSSAGGGRAAAVRLEMTQGGVLNEQAATEKFQRADQIASLQATVTQLESRLAATENSLKQMEGRVAQLESSKSGCACTIS